MKICWILLAAGSGKRFGENKLLYPFRGKPLYCHGYAQIKSAAQQRQETLIVVTVHRQIADAVQKEGIIVAWNNTSQEGIVSSIKCGLSATKGIQNDMAYLFCVADQPFLTTSVLLAFADGFLQSGKDMGCMAYGTQWGNPAIFCGNMAKKLLDLNGDKGGKQLLRKNPECVFVYACPTNKILYDIDTKEDLEHI